MQDNSKTLTTGVFYSLFYVCFYQLVAVWPRCRATYRSIHCDLYMLHSGVAHKQSAILFSSVIYSMLYYLWDCVGLWVFLFNLSMSSTKAAFLVCVLQVAWKLSAVSQWPAVATDSVVSSVHVSSLISDSCRSSVSKRRC